MITGDSTRDPAMTLSALRGAMQSLANPNKATDLQRFFKTGPGEYGEGDIFLGLTVPVLRKLAQQAGTLGLTEILDLLRSPIHEERFLALVLLVRRYQRADAAGREEIYTFYLQHTVHINNWDLVDASAPAIVGDHLQHRAIAPLYSLARAESLWERRIAIIATFPFIRRQQFDPTLRIAAILLEDPQDLIHKAVGWMLREVGKRDQNVEEGFLVKHYRNMPRVMLRYAIEKFPVKRRQNYLRGEISENG